MKVSLTVGERTAIMQMLRSKISEDIEVLLDYRQRAKEFDLTDEEKVLVGYEEVKEIGKIKWEDEIYAKEFEIDKTTVRYFLELTKEKVKTKTVNAAQENLLSAYKKITEGKESE